MVKLHHILIPSVLGLAVGALSATFVVYLAQTPVEPSISTQAPNEAALAQRICHLEDEVFVLGSLVDLYQGILNIPDHLKMAETDFQDALDVDTPRLESLVRMTHPSD